MRKQTFLQKLIGDIFYHSNIVWQENRSYLIYLTWYNLKFYQEYESTDPGEETNDKFDGKKVRHKQHRK